MQWSGISQLVRGSESLKMQSHEHLLPPVGNGSVWLAHVGLGDPLYPINRDLECGQVETNMPWRAPSWMGVQVSGSSIRLLMTTDGISPAPAPQPTVLLTLLGVSSAYSPFL